MQGWSINQEELVGASVEEGAALATKFLCRLWEMGSPSSLVGLEVVEATGPCGGRVRLQEHGAGNRLIAWALGDGLVEQVPPVVCSDN